jgi:hypothetical protein
MIGANQVRGMQIFFSATLEMTENDPSLLQYTRFYTAKMITRNFGTARMQNRITSTDWVKSYYPKISRCHLNEHKQLL